MLILPVQLLSLGGHARISWDVDIASSTSITSGQSSTPRWDGCSNGVTNHVAATVRKVTHIPDRRPMSPNALKSCHWQLALLKVCPSASVQSDTTMIVLLMQMKCPNICISNSESLDRRGPTCLDSPVHQVNGLLKLGVLERFSDAPGLGGRGLV